MDWQTLGTFLVATAVLIVTPGPVMAIVIGNTLHGGQVVGFRTVLGIGLGEVALIGLFAISFLLSSRLFGDYFCWLSLASAAYLAWLAANTVLFGAKLSIGERRRPSTRPFFDGLAVTVSNPMALLFYSAFFMPFVRDSHSLAAQLGILAALYVLLSLVFDLTCVVFVARLARRCFRSSYLASVARWCSAAVYLGTSGLAVSSFLHALTP